MSQSMYYSLQAPELPVVCVKMLVHESHSKHPQEFKYYQALAGDILPEFGESLRVMEQGTQNTPNFSRESPDVSPLFTVFFQNSNLRPRKCSH